MNVITIVGALGQDPKIHQTEKTKIASFSIATNDWNGKEVTNWHNVKAFGKTAEIVERYAKKGTKIAVTGSMFYPTWEKDGVTKYGTEIVANRIELLSKAEPMEKMDSKPAEPIESEEDSLPF